MNKSTNGTNIRAIHINGKAIKLAQATNLNQVLEQYQAQSSLPDNFALALNQNFVGKADYDSTEIKPGDSLDIFSPIQGG